MSGCECELSEFVSLDNKLFHTVPLGEIYEVVLN